MLLIGLGEGHYDNIVFLLETKQSIFHITVFTLLNAGLQINAGYVHVRWTKNKLQMYVV